MLLKTITALNMDDAMAQVRKALGDDAIIVSTSRDEASGGVKVTAALDKTLPSEQPVPHRISSLATADSANTDAPPLDERAPLAQAVIDIVGEAFDRHGVPRPLGDPILEEIRELEVDDPVLALAGVFDNRYAFTPLDDFTPDQPIILVGPPGAGKTLLTAKLATWAVLHKKNVRAITTDVVKAGGLQQLQAYTDAIKINLHPAPTVEDVEKAISPSGGVDLTIIDTVGVNPYDRNEFAHLKTLIDISNAEPVLVLPAGGDAIEAGHIAQNFRDIGVERFVYTRLDITRKYGSFLRIVEKGGFRFSNVSISPLIAEGFLPLTPVSLARLFIKGHDA